MTEQAFTVVYVIFARKLEGSNHCLTRVDLADYSQVDILSLRYNFVNYRAWSHSGLQRDFVSNSGVENA